jgi:hypothetical protein
MPDVRQHGSYSISGLAPGLFGTIPEHANVSKPLPAGGLAGVVTTVAYTEQRPLLTVTANNTPTVQAPPVQVNRVMGTNGVLVESRDRANPGVIIHRTFIAK